MNAGQSCVAVDYVLAHSSIKPALISAMAECVESFYGSDPYKSGDYARIVNEKQFNRIVRLLNDGKIVIGGQSDRSARYIAPTIISEVRGTEPVMEEEIFGPLLPVLEYDELTEAISAINNKPKPLAIYVFTRNRGLQKRIFNETSSGGGCVNDTVVHETSKHIPFGGIGESGIGKYHGKASFDTFSHQRSIVRNNMLFDLRFRYPPYNGALKWLKMLF